MSLRWFLLVLAALPVIGGCKREAAQVTAAAAQTSPVTHTDPPRVQRPAPVAAPASAAPDPRTRALPRGADAAQRILGLLPAEARESIARSPVSALMPMAPELASAAFVTTGDSWYALSIRHGELTISLHATDVSHPAPGDLQAPPRRHRVRGVPATITQNEGIRSVAWEEGGVAYALEIECFHHEADVRCTEDAYARALAESLVRVGGRR